MIDKFIYLREPSIKSFKSMLRQTDKLFLFNETNARSLTMLLRRYCIPYCGYKPHKVNRINVRSMSLIKNKIDLVF